MPHAEPDARPRPCPKCRTTLSHVKRAGQLLEACPGCEGLWFDPGELTLLLEVYRKVDDQGAPTAWVCPRCETTTLVVRPFPGTSVEVDRCAGCGGTWLDRGELETLREQLRTIVDGAGSGREAAATSARALVLLDDAVEARSRRFACLRCGGRLHHLKKEGQLVEQCEACRGLWLDAGELTLLVGVYRELDVAAGAPVDARCLGCDEPLRRLTFPGTRVSLDGCPGCRGAWLDGGALDALKDALRGLVGDAGPALQERAKELLKQSDKRPALPPGCPACRRPLKVEPVRGVVAEGCAACGGQWLESGLLTKALGVTRKWKLKEASPVERRCIRCPSQQLVSLAYPGTALLLDVCPDCRGTWLPKGRLDELAAALGV